MPQQPKERLGPTLYEGQPQERLGPTLHEKQPKERLGPTLHEGGAWLSFCKIKLSIVMLPNLSHSLLPCLESRS